MIVRLPPTVNVLRWPQDYARVDAGLWVRPDLVDAFADRGWRTAADVLDANVFVVRQVQRHGARRDNCRLTLNGATYFLKRHTGATDRGVLSECAVAAGSAEAEAAEACRAAGVPALATAAVGVERAPGAERSFFLSERVPGEPADDLWPKLHGDDERRSVIAALAATARRLHAAGLFHRDLYWCHFFVERTAGGAVARLIDLQRVLRPRLAVKWRMKDLAQFHYSTPAGAEDWRPEWLREYYRRAELTVAQKLLEQAVAARAALYARKGHR